jgi:hypothetical protein
MKKFLKPILAVLPFLVFAVQSIKAQTLVASYPFNGNANDASGNNNNGTVFGASLTTDRFGNANSAYSFDGSSSYIDVPNNPTLQLSNAYTLSAWVKPNGFYSGPCQANFILAKGAQASEGHYNLQYGDFLDGNCGTFTPANENFASTIRKGGTEQSVFENPSTLPVTLNNWYYVVCTYDGMSQKLFVNGKLRASNTTAGSFGVLNTENLFIGKSNDASGYFVNGVIDDIKIYSGPLTDAQVFDAYTNDLKKPGSGNAVQFDGTNQRIEIPDNDSWNLGAGDFTIEGWINPQSLVGSPTIITQSVAGAGSNQSSFYIGVSYNGPGSLDMYSTTGTGWTHGISTNAGVITTGKWQHFSIVRISGTTSVYVNGILQSLVQSPFSGSFGVASPMFNGTMQLTIGMQSANPANVYNGAIDEIRIFKGTGLTQTQVRDWMCKKITSSHPAYQNLVGYFRLDEGSSTVTSGFNGNFGTLINSPTWQTSGTPLGDAANHDFVNATKTANISAATGENFSVTSTSGSPDGIVVYHVAEAPNSNTGANNGGNNKYFGVFQSGGTTPQYTAVYNYTGNPLVNAGNESSLRLAKRNNNAVTTWAQLSALPNEPANTITVTGESTEYILGSVGTPLPVTLLSFAASKCNSGVCLLWSTENEQDFSHFEIEKSVDGTRFSSLTSVTALNTAQRNSYTAVDNNPANGANYYRLKQVNMDARFTYSRILKVDLTKPQLVSIQPNPAQNSVLIKGLAGYGHIRLMDMNGKIILQKNIQQPIEEINISQLPVGIYMLQAVKENEITTIKLLKQ